MNRDAVIRLAREANGTPYKNRYVEGTAFAFTAGKLDRFAALVEAEVRKEVEAARVPLTVSEINSAFDKHKAAICLVGSDIQGYRIAVANAIQDALGIQPTSSEGGDV